MPIQAFQQRLTETNRKRVHMDAPPAGSEVVAQLMDEDQHAEHEAEGDDGAGKGGQQFEHRGPDPRGSGGAALSGQLQGLSPGSGI